jgi:hypothetical protein
MPIYGFYEEKIPIFRETNTPHELESLLTVDEVNGMVARIVFLEDLLKEIERIIRDEV